MIVSREDHKPFTAAYGYRTGMALSGSGWIRIILSDWDRHPGHAAPDPADSDHYQCWIRFLIFLPNPDPGSMGQKGTGSRIPDPHPQHWSPGSNLKFLLISSYDKPELFVRTPLNLNQSGYGSGSTALRVSRPFLILTCFRSVFAGRMVMEPPSPQCVGREFVRQYYTLLNQAPLHLHRYQYYRLLLRVHIRVSLIRIRIGILL